MRATTEELHSAMKRSVSWLGRPAYPWLLGAMGLTTLVALGTGFDLAHQPGGESAMLHGWLGLAACAGMLLHLLAHRSWLRAMVGPWLEREPRSAPRGWLQVALLGGVVVALAASGIALGGLGGGPLGHVTAWQGLHHLSSKVLLALGLWHLVRHRRWLAARFLSPRVAARW